MSTLKDLSKRFRFIADEIDSLLGMEKHLSGNGTSAVAQRIREDAQPKSVKARKHDQSYLERFGKRHWTQTPKGKAIMAKWGRTGGRPARKEAE